MKELNKDDFLKFMKTKKTHKDELNKLIRSIIYNNEGGENEQD
jgi:hypothetical protein